MSISTRTQYLVGAAAVFGAALFFVFEVPFAGTVVFTALCIAWSAWCFHSVFRGGDELQSASLRYALAAASGFGVPLTVVCVMLMIALPEFQGLVTKIASHSGSGLSLPAVGFGLGVTFAVLLQCAVFALGHSLWWVSKR